MNLSDENLAIGRLARTRGVGMATYRKLLARCGSAPEIIARWESFFAHGKAARPLAKEADVLREIEALQKLGGTLVVWGDADYPPALAQLPDAPLVLSVLGDAKLLKARQVAVVGNRSASGHGLKWTEDLCRQLAGTVVVTSGLARGIDTAAHKGALAAGHTIAVVAGGVDHIYPPENAALRAEIIARGCVVSEQALGSAPTAQLFPRRNRVIAGLSVGIVVAEASRHSGSLLTAEFALGYGREVWAVPGSPGDPRASGPNFLLKQGAQLVEGAEDILRNLPHAAAPYVAPARVETADLFESAGERVAVEDGIVVEESATAAQEPRQMIWALLGRVGISFDHLLRQSALEAPALQLLLTELELDGLAQKDALGGWLRS